MESNSTLQLDDDSRDLMEAAFQAYLDKLYENPTERDYIMVILGLFDNIIRRVRAELPGEPGRPRKDMREKVDLYWAMSTKRKRENLGSDRAAQALFRENDFGRKSWKALKAAYYTYRRDLIKAYLPEDQNLSDGDLDAHLRLCIALARQDHATLLGGSW